MGNEGGCPQGQSSSGGMQESVRVHEPTSQVGLPVLTKGSALAAERSTQARIWEFKYRDQLKMGFKYQDHWVTQLPAIYATSISPHKLGKQKEDYSFQVLTLTLSLNNISCPSSYS